MTKDNPLYHFLRPSFFHLSDNSKIFVDKIVIAWNTENYGLNYFVS